MESDLSIETTTKIGRKIHVNDMFCSKYEVQIKNKQSYTTTLITSIEETMEKERLPEIQTDQRGMKLKRKRNTREERNQALASVLVPRRRRDVARSHAMPFPISPRILSDLI